MDCDVKPANFRKGVDDRVDPVRPFLLHDEDLLGVDQRKSEFTDLLEGFASLVELPIFERDLRHVVVLWRVGVLNCEVVHFGELDVEVVAVVVVLVFSR